MQQLTSNTLLQGGRYRIEKYLGQGGFGITYLANHEMLDCKVAIKEFFYKEYCDRDNDSHVTIGTEGNRDIVERFKQKFIKEAKTIFKLHHPNIIQIHDIFTENDTAYYVMEHIGGESLGDIVKRCGALSESEAICYIKKVGSALSYIHSMNINHLDVKPGNIMLRASDNEVVLIDFGVAKQYDAETREGTTTTPVGISHGYSPLEQYRSNGVQEFSPQSDVYALAATLFKLLTGNTPPEAIEIQEEGVPVEDLKAKHISDDTIKSIEAAMKSRKKRTQTIDEFLSMLPNIQNELVLRKDDSKEETVLINDVVDKHESKELQTSEGTVILNAVPVIHEDKDFLDLGLSVRWSKKNTGEGHYYTPDKLESIEMPNEHSRIPAKDEWDELIQKCSFKWVELPQKGYEIEGPNGNTIFLPALGMASNAEQRFYGEQCCYWNTIDNHDTLSYAILCENYKITNCKVAKTRNDVGFPIRLVIDK